MKIKDITDINELAKSGLNRLESDTPQLLFGLGTCGIACNCTPLQEFATKYLAKKKFKADFVPVGCIGMCYPEPLVDVKLPGQPRVTYGFLDQDKLKRILDEHVLGGQPVKELALGQLSNEISECGFGTIKYDNKFEGIPTYQEMPFFAKQKRIALRNCGIIDPIDIEQYTARGGIRSAHKALNQMSPSAVIDEIKRSAIRGRGGAGFPTSTKWEFARNSKDDQKYIICNDDEGDPGAYANRGLLEGDPYAVLEGMIIGAYAIGASQGYIYCRAEYPLAIERLKIAIAECEKRGMLGQNILGSKFSFNIGIVEGAGAFVCGEETALIGSIQGRRGEPKPRPPYPAVSGLFGKPTIINNVETLANMPLIIEKGGYWLSTIGTEGSKGTKVFSLVGKIERAGLVEIPMGTFLKDIIYEIGGGCPDGRKFKAVQTGGPSGGCITTENLGVAVDYETLKALGSIVGSGGMVVKDEDTCMVEIARYFLSFTGEESCGQCTPCRYGLRNMLKVLEKITTGKGQMSDIELLEKVAMNVRDTSLCALGGTAPNPVLTTLKYFKDEYVEHIKNKHCRASVCATLFKAPCQNTCPAGTDVPSYIQLIKEYRLKEAYEVNMEYNPFPSICSRVCEHVCETRCQREQIDEPIAIRSLKRVCADAVFAKKDYKPKVAHLNKMNKKIAVVGGGPAGLSAAYYLARLGYDPTGFESADKLGGMLRYAIPSYRLPHDVIEKEIENILAQGIQAKCNMAVGKDIKLSQLIKDYDAVCLAVGAQADKKLELENENLPNIIPGLKFLRDVSDNKDTKLGKEIIVIGGGNVAIDVARSALRKGAAKVTICYRREENDMPAYPEEILQAKEEGVKFIFAISPERILHKDGQATGMLFRKMKASDYSKFGRRNFLPGQETMEIKAANIIVAIGQSMLTEFAKEFAEKLVSKGTLISADKEALNTAMDKVFAAGDAVTGPASVIEAIAQGKQAARSIDKKLSGLDRCEELAQLTKYEFSMEEPKNTDKMTREHPVEIPVAQRKNSFAEVVMCYDKKACQKESDRCLRCDLSRPPESESESARSGELQTTTSR